MQRQRTKSPEAQPSHTAATEVLNTHSSRQTATTPEPGPSHAPSAKRSAAATKVAGTSTKNPPKAAGTSTKNAPKASGASAKNIAQAPASNERPASTKRSTRNGSVTVEDVDEDDVIEVPSTSDDGQGSSDEGEDGWMDEAAAEETAEQELS